MFRGEIVKWTIATAVAIAIVVIAITLTISGDREENSVSIGPAGGTASEGDVTVAIPGGAVTQEVEPRIERIGGETAVTLLPGMRPLAPVYSIDIDGALRRHAQIRFSVDVAGAGPRYVASRETASDMWTLQRARSAANGKEAVISTNDFSLFQPLESFRDWTLAKTETAVATFLRLGGVRASEPRCGPPPFGYDLHGDIGTGDANALIFACLEAAGSEMALHIVNNRAIGMEYALPHSLRVSSLTSPDLPDALMDAVRTAQGHSPWRSISATGEVVLTGQPGKREVAIEPTLRSFAFDLAVFAIGQVGGKAAKAAAAANYLDCVRGAAHQLGLGSPSSVQEAMDAALGIWRRCGGTLAAVGKGAAARAGAVFFGGMKLGTGTADAVAELLAQQRADLQIAKAPAALLSFSANGGVEAVGPFSVLAGDRTILDAVAAFGKPGSIEPGPTGCELTWPDLGLKADAVNYGSRGSECTPERGYINDFVITSELFQTEAGLRVGMAEGELLARHPTATTRGGDPTFDDELAPSGTLYGVEQMASPIATTGVLLTLKVLVRNGKVLGLEVTPLLGGD